MKLPLSLYFLLVLIPVASLTAQNSSLIRPIGSLSSLDQANISLKKTSFYKKGKSFKSSAYTYYQIDNTRIPPIYNSLRFLRLKDIKRVEKKAYKKGAGCNLPYNLIKIATKNPVHIYQDLSYESGYGLGNLFHPYNNTRGFTQKHKVSFFKRIPRYELQGYSEFLNYAGSKAHDNFRQINSRLSFSQNNLFDYKLKLGGLVYVNHMSHRYMVPPEVSLEGIRQDKYFNYYLKPSASYQLLPFLQTKVVYKNFTNQSHEFEKISGEEFNSALDFTKKFEDKHHLHASLSIGTKSRKTVWVSPFYSQTQQASIDYTFANYLAWELAYWQAQNQFGKLNSKFSDQYINGGFRFKSKELHLKAVDSSKYYRNKTKIELFGRVARLRNPSVKTDALELGSELIIKGILDAKLGLSYRFSDIQLQPNTQMLDPSIFIFLPKVYKEFEEKGFKTTLSASGDFSDFYVKLKAVYRRQNGFAREVSVLESNVYWNAFRLYSHWENIKGWKLSSEEADFSRLSDLSIYYTIKNIKAPHIEKLHFHVSSQNLFIAGDLGALHEKRSLNRADSPYTVPIPLAKNILLGITADFN